VVGRVDLMVLNMLFSSSYYGACTVFDVLMFFYERTGLLLLILLAYNGV